MDIDKIEIDTDYALEIDSVMHSRPVFRQVTVTQIYKRTDGSFYLKCIDVESTRVHRNVHPNQIINTWEDYLKEYNKTQDEIERNRTEAKDIEKTLKELDFPVDLTSITPHFRQDENAEEKFCFSNEQMRDIIEWALTTKEDGLGRIFR